jgi:hypothetical protein
VATAGEDGEGAGLGATLWIFITLAGVSCALTLLFLSMRAVMDVGGQCAEGGPFVIRQHCPKGSTAMLLGGIWGGLLLVGLYGWHAVTRGIPSLLGLVWPALFLSLGFNFLQYAFDPPGGGGLVVGWFIPGILFVLMGGLPLLVAIPSILRAFSGAAPVPPTSSAGPMRSALSSMRPMVRPAQGWGPRLSAPAAPASGELVSELERLDALHRSGGLDDREYQAAKRRILGTET